MKIEVLVSTMDQGFDLDAPRPAGVNFLVVNQITPEEAEAAEDYRLKGERQGVRVLNFEERGLSKSRNRAIAAATGDICLIADDDIIFKDDLGETILTGYQAHPEATAIVFQVEDGSGRLIKAYSKTQFWLDKFSATSVSSVEISFRRDAVLASNVIFDTKFGLGAEFVSGEENIFLLDLIAAGYSATFVPQTIAAHHGPTSGGRFENDAVVVSKGAIVRRMYGNLSYPVAVGFALKKSLQHRTNPFRMIWLVTRGWFSSGL